MTTVDLLSSLAMAMKRIPYLCLPVLCLGLLGSRCDEVDIGETRVLCARDGEEPSPDSHAICSDASFCNGIEFCDPTHPLRDSRNCVSTDPCVTLGLQQVLDKSRVPRRDCSEPDDEDRGTPFRVCRSSRDCEEDECWDTDDGLVVDREVLVSPIESNGEVLDHVDGFRYSIDCLRAVCTQEICNSRCGDDNIFCNGTESCEPGVGCLHSGDPCADEDEPKDAEEGFFECVEDGDRCDWICADEDGDGVSAKSCGGDDCDDNDADRFPGNPEVCDDEGLDEDCDPDTVGSKDEDGDGYVSADCTNEIDGKVVSEGPDCDDKVAEVSPGNTEVCNGVDDNCDGDVDFGLTIEMFVDEDGDGFGAEGTAVVRCPYGEGFSFIGGDCDDTNPHMFPGAIYCADPGNVQVPTYQLCQADGTFTNGSCLGSCVLQPSGVGVCL